jgi:hypothetical protein
MLLSSVSTRIILNGVPDQCICHGRGLRQGDPLSPLLFVLAMKVLNSLFGQTEECNLFTSLHALAIRFIVSLYADDLMVFLTPNEADVRLACAIMEFFADALGLRTNIAKCQFGPIRCSNDQVAQVQQCFPCQVISFPFCNLGVPLSTHKLKKDDLMPLVNAVADRLPSWKSGLMSKVGRTTLFKSTLMSLHDRGLPCQRS